MGVIGNVKVSQAAVAYIKGGAPSIRGGHDAEAIDGSPSG